jgi:two-component system, LytTR family, sensor kinase
MLGFFTAVGLSLTLYQYLDFVANRHSISFWEPFIWEMTGAWFAAPLFLFVVPFARRYPFRRGHIAPRLTLHFAVLLAYSAVHTSLLWVSRIYIYPAVGLGRYDYGVMRVRYLMEFFHDCIGYVVVVSIVYLFDARLRGAQLEGKLAAARLENLRLQLQPHFLFNALNTISSVMYDDPRKADVMIARLGDLLRSSISDSDAQEVPLEREIETLELYLDVMRQRFEDKLRVDFQVAADVRHALVPHLLLQPLVENSIKHGVDPLSHAVSVTITAARLGEATHIAVRDSGQGLPTGKLRKGTGLSNTAERLQRLYGAQHKLALENGEGGGLLVTVDVPYRV